MNHFLIKGTFHVVGFSPDGDSIRFKADKESLWSKLGAEEKRLEKFQTEFNNYEGAVQLRLLGIDALETHYKPKNATSGVSYAQPTTIGRQAAEALMSFLGFEGNIDWDGNGRVKKGSVQVDGIHGYIVAAKLDDKGRPLAWVFPGKNNDKSWSVNKLVPQSANCHLLKNGLVYPFFFEDLGDDLQHELAVAAKKAAKKGHEKGVWAADQTMDGLRKPTANMITKESVMLPYLFRKLIDRWYKPGASLREKIDFKDYPKKNSFLGHLITVQNGVMRMNKYPWDVVFEEW